MRDAEYWIQRLGLQPHPEGGFYLQTYTSAEAALPGYPGPRPFGTAIYFLLRHPEFSTFHRLASDEIWHFYAGEPLTLWVIAPDGTLSELRLGPDPEQGQGFQAVVPANCWFAAQPDRPGYSLVGCTMAPGFDFADFEMASRAALARQYPRHQPLIERLTRQP